MSEREGGPDRSVEDADGGRLGAAMSPVDEHEPVRTPEADPGADAEFERQMAIGRRSMRKHRNVLAALGTDTDAERAAASVPTRADDGSRIIVRSLAT